MENNVVSLSDIKKNATPKKSKEDYTGEGFSFEEEVDKDITNLSNTLDITKDEAVQVAKNFYRKYPMLMEFIRTPNELLRR